VVTDDSGGGRGIKIFVYIGSSHWVININDTQTWKGNETKGINKYSKNLVPVVTSGIIQSEKGGIWYIPPPQHSQELNTILHSSTEIPAHLVS